MTEISAAPELPIGIRVVNRITWAAAVVAGVALAVMTVHVFIGAVSRRAGFPLQGVMEFTSNWWMILLVFLALAYAQQRGHHIRVTALLDGMSPLFKRVVDVVCLALAAMVMIFVVVVTWQSAVHSAEVQESVKVGLTIPVWPAKFALPVGGALLVIQYIAQIVLVVIRPEAVEEEDEIASMEEKDIL